MDIAEQAAQAQKESDIDMNFPFYNGKNLTNSLDEQETTTKVGAITIYWYMFSLYF